MKSLVRIDAASLVWLALVALTLTSWALGSWRIGTTHAASGGIVILIISVFKVRLVGLYFMELRRAPKWLRAIFEGYSVTLLIVLTSMYLLA